MLDLDHRRPKIIGILVPSGAPLSSFPSDVLKRIKESANGLIAFKLMQVNKYFVLERLPLTVVGPKTELKDNDTILTSYGQNSILFDADQTAICVGELTAYRGAPLSQFAAKIAFSKISHFVCYYQRISDKTFQRLIGKELVDLELRNYSCVVGKDGKILNISQILELLPPLKSLNISYISRICSKETEEAIISSNLKNLEIEDIWYNFDFENFASFIKKRKPELALKMYFVKDYPGASEHHQRILKFIKNQKKLLNYREWSYFSHSNSLKSNCHMCKCCDFKNFKNTFRVTLVQEI